MPDPTIHERIAALELAESEGPYEAIDTRKLDELRADRNEGIKFAAETLADSLFAALTEDIAPKLTCGEAEAFAALYEALGQSHDAASVIDAHSYGDDDPTDRHYRG